MKNMTFNISKDEIEKVYYIYQKQVELFKENQKDKYSFVWFMGTDYFTYLARINNLYYSILSNMKSKFNMELDLDNDLILIEWKESIIKNKNENRYYFNLYKQNITLKEDKIYLASCNFKRGNNFQWDFHDKKFYNQKENLMFLYSKSAYRQWLQVVASFGFIEIIDKFIPNTLYSLIFPYNEKDKYNSFDFEKLALSFLDNYKDYFNFRYLKGYCIRDIFLSLHFAFLYKLYENTPKLFNNFHFVLREGKKITDFSNSFKLHQNNKSSIEKNWDTQTTIKKMITNNPSKAQLFFIQLNNFLFDKFKNGWEIEYLNIQTKNLEIYINNNKGRPGQVQYRLGLLLADKRVITNNDETFYINKNDLIENIQHDFAVESSHILDFAKCENDQERYDPENGLLLEPTIHTLFDKNQITFNEEGTLYIKKTHYDEITRLIKRNNLLPGIKNTVLTLKTKEFVKKRIEKNGINFSDFKQYTI